MLLCHAQRRRALHIPVLLTVLAVPVAFGGVAAVSTEANVRSVVLLVFALGFAFFALTQYRLISSRQGTLYVHTMLGVKSIRAGDVALGVSVHHGGRGLPTYTVYAQTDSGRVSLADTLSEAGAMKARKRLDNTLLTGVTPAGDAQAENARRVADNEARWRGNRAQAQAAVDECYRKPGIPWRTVPILLFLVVIVSYIALIVANQVR